MSTSGRVWEQQAPKSAFYTPSSKGRFGHQQTLAWCPTPVITPSTLVFLPSLTLANVPRDGVQNLVPEKQHKSTAGWCKQTFLPGPPSPGVQQCPQQGSAEARGVGPTQGPGRAVPQPSEGRAVHPCHSSALHAAAITSVSRDFCQAQRPLGLDPLRLGCHLRACHPLEKQPEVSPTASCPFPRRSCYCDLNGPVTRPLSKP